MLLSQSFLHSLITFVPITKGTYELYSVGRTPSTGIANSIFGRKGTSITASIHPVWDKLFPSAHCTFKLKLSKDRSFGLGSNVL